MSNKSTNVIQEIESPVMEPEIDDLMNRRTGKLLQKIAHNFYERIGKGDILLDEVLERTLELIPPFWQYPEITCARIILEKKEFRTENFIESPWGLVSKIRIKGKSVGTIEVYYGEERPEMDEGPFLKEESRLLYAVAERLAKISQRLSTEKSLKEKIDYQESLFKYANAPMIVWDSDIKITMFNPAFERLSGYLANAVIGKKLNFLFPEASLGKSLGNIIKTLNDGRWKLVEIAILCKDGAMRTVLWNSANIYAKDGKTIISTIAQGQDISERKEIEKKLQESEVLHRILTENVADGIVLFQDEKILFTNKAFSSMLGHTDSDIVIGSKMVSYIGKGYKQSFLQVIEVFSMEGLKTNGFDGQLVSRNGQNLWIEANLNLIKWNGKNAILMTVRDVTEKKIEEIKKRDKIEYLRRKNIKLRSSVKERYRLGNIIGKSEAIQEVYELILKVQSTNANVIVYGESGTGKELVVRAISEMDSRHSNEFVAVNCGAIPETLLEREFFGHKKGAFTGADKDVLGFLDLADGGVLFLDEVGELNLSMQKKLLRAIDEGGYSPVGGNSTLHSDFRIIAATNKNLMDQVNKGLMREDFYYRIHIVPITLPPLRERKDDIPLLIDYFLKAYNDKNLHTILKKDLEILYNYNWPGNVRELKNVIERFVTFKNFDFLKTSCFGADSSGDFSEVGLEEKNQTLNDIIQNVEKNKIFNTLQTNCWHRTKAASILGINRKTLFKKIKYYNLKPISSNWGLMPHFGS